jgi:hypothetical protein
VRQLDNELRRCIALLGDEREITADMLSPEVLEAAP